MALLKKIRLWLGRRFRLILLTHGSFEQKKWLNFNRFGFISLMIGLILLIIAITVAVIVFTPVKEMIPGYPDKETRIASGSNASRLDSLAREIELRDQYLTNLKQVLLGEKLFNPALEISENLNNPSSYSPKSNTDDDKQMLTLNNNFNLKIPGFVSEQPKTDMIFFPPVKGMVTNSFDPVRDHYGTDIVTPDDEVVRATLAGTVISANWTMETGYTIQIQHRNNYISTYRHLKKLLVKTGQQVDAGESIGVYGNTGEISYGPHLHFELWHKGEPLNPENYIDFE
ncbi:MAG: M23 family metallopeptidase [Bacteroidales bacterium]